ncbi:hypothetical protein NLG07_07820 [Alteromonas sp. LMIT006]|uniref:hypothetical protein n=1 Tax=Alteromonadaceae TaxID=72275 RepID=UPI0020CA740E|nr:hypothetical protein [Alteromonas sp. LMIT006]UTP71917.1 hypothetical protein NLG07_07820 [Alteromonas sp. LMIT006]
MLQLNSLALALALTRAGIIISRFFLFFYIAKRLSVEEFGQYNLYIVFLSIGVFVIGFDVYNFFNKEVARVFASGIEKVKYLLRTQFSLYYFVYIILLIITFYYIGTLEFFIIFILISEHFVQEVSRVLNFVDEQLMSALLIFARSVFYPLLLLIFSFYSGDVSLSLLIYLWTASNGLVLLFSIVFFVKKFGITILIPRIRGINRYKKNIFYGCLVFFPGSIGFKVVEFQDRILASNFLSDFDLGIISFFSSLASIIPTLYLTIFIPLRLPNLINNKLNFHSFLKESLFFLVIFFVLILVLVNFLVIYLYTDYEHFLILGFCLIATQFIISLSLVFHYIIYALSDCRYISLPPFLVLLFTFVMSFYMESGADIFEIVVVFTSSSFLLLASRFFIFKYCVSKDC